MTALRIAFPKGCRVRLSPRGRLGESQRPVGWEGTVVGYGLKDGMLLVLWQGRNVRQAWHRDYVERVTP